MPAGITMSGTSAYWAWIRAARSWYQITIGGAAGADASLGQVIGPSVAKAEVAETIARLLDVYVERREADERFLDTVRRSA